MNNAQFRRLLADNTSPSTNEISKHHGSSRSGDGASGGGERLPSRPLALGSKMRSSIPMTPRSVTGIDFARQLAGHRRESQPPPLKKFKSSAAPKGTKLAAGYQDRTLLRRLADDQRNTEDRGDREDLEKRVRALEEMVKLGQIDQPTFEKLMAEIGIGGDVGSTHLIKGLDWKLLQRVKAGEDILNPPPPSKDEHCVDDEFERVLEEKEKEAGIAVKKEEKGKRDTMAPATVPPPGRKMTRDDILKQLKATRTTATTFKQAPEPPASTLGAKFKKVGEQDRKKRWIEKDEHGRRREVLLTTDSEGKTKRKVRWLDKNHDGQQKSGDHNLLAPDKNAKPLGMEVPAEILSKSNALPEVPEDDDIFEGVGADYNPLGDIGDDDDDDSSSAASEEETERKEGLLDLIKEPTDPTSPKRQGRSAESGGLPQPLKPRNYFSTSSAEEVTDIRDHSNPLSSDPTVLAALKRAATIQQSPASSRSIGDHVGDVDTNPETLSRRRKFLEEIERRDRQDAMDMDLGFGESRFGDEDEDDGAWDGEGTGNKRKRGPKKKKGNKESIGDVMRVLEGRRKGGDKAKET